MRQVLLYIAASLDGKIARKDHSLDWLPPIENENGEDYGYKELIDRIDTVVMGYNTYEISAGLGEWGFKEMNNYVFTRDNTKPHIPCVNLITEDPVAFIKALKQSDGKDIWLIGGGEIIRQLHDAGLIDQYMIATIPVILGEGIDLFKNITKEQPLKVTHHKQYDALIMTHYVKAEL